MSVCKHLDFKTNYSDCKIVTHDGVQCWERGPTWLHYEGAPRLVQFCDLRGRLNDPMACTSKERARCREFATRSCNRHTDCDAADAKAKAAGRWYAEHCHDDCCEDCFGS